MSYVNVDVQTLEDTIRSGVITIEQGQADFANRISEAEEMIEEDERKLNDTEESIKAIESEVETLKAESDSLSRQISDLRDEEMSAYRNGDESQETSARTQADYYEKQREELGAKIRDLNQEKDNLFGIKYDEEQMLATDQATLESLQADKEEFDKRCEEIRQQNARMEKERTAVLEK